VSTISAVAIAVVSEVKDPMDLGRVQVRLSSSAGGAREWARVVSPPVGPTRTGLQLGVGDQVLVVFEQGDSSRPFVIGKVWNGAQPAPISAPAVHLPTGSILHAIVGNAEPLVDCALTADLQRQTAAWLASTECLLKILALLKPLIDVIEHLPTPLPSTLQEFAMAAADLHPWHYRPGAPISP
jgi:Type VI secretion system/phage-baseplate injector OB domain